MSQREKKLDKNCNPYFYSFCQDIICLCKDSAYNTIGKKCRFSLIAILINLVKIVN